ncbi:MAG: Hsp20/alpha crystallin family protein [Opitutales bacterium]|nr:Hsp20/alpha crystallin family protein [Opitutales bacterium]MCH8541638.1 Hsp20/alpha crystallin family protein [Opitutales bacterium]
MQITKWHPLWEIQDMFDRYLRTSGEGQALAPSGDWSPRVDISETDKAFIIKAEVPEVNKEDVSVSFENGVLSISGERKQEAEEKGKTFHRVERHYGSFCRSFSLPENVDDENIKATFKDGMLKLEIPKIEKAKPKAIEVKVE